MSDQVLISICLRIFDPGVCRAAFHAARLQLNSLGVWYVQGDLQPLLPAER